MSSSRTEREELDYQYSPSRWSTRLAADVIVETHRSVVLEATKVARQSVKCDLAIEYIKPGGPQLDIYYPSTSEGGPVSNAVFVYFHGGYWMEMGVEYAGVCAIPLTKNGVTMVAVGYSLAPKVNMTTIVEQCIKAVLFIKKRFSQERIFLAGHSAGAHLAAVMTITDWRQYGLETHPFCGSILISGLYDLAPLQRMYCDDTLHLTDQEIRELSPQLQADKLKELPAAFPCLLVWAEEDSTEFKRQSHEFSQVLLANGVVCTSQEMAGKDHFEVLEKLSSEDYSLMQVTMQH